MSLNRFQQCDPSHNYQYCCIKSNLIACQQCWFKQGHPYRCMSSKCGHYQKIAHQVIQRLLEMKVMHCTSEMSSSYNQYDKIFKILYRAKQAITMKIKSDIENKLPLFLWTAILEMLAAKFPKFSGLTYEESTCSEMLKIIKAKQQTKVQLLQQAVKSLEKTNHAFEGLSKKLKQKKYSGTSDQQAAEVAMFCTTEGNRLMANLSQQLKKHINLETSKFLKRFNPDIQFDGVKFNTKRGFEQIQCYNNISLCNTLFPPLNQQCIPYNGFNMDIQKLEQTPQQLLQLTKSVLKSKIFSIHSSITQMKSLYPYKYGYIIGTTVQPDPQYELLILNLQKHNIKLYEKNSQNVFLNSINLIIMGPELITVQFKNFPKRMTQICIYGYVDGRQKHYNFIIDNYICTSKERVYPSENKKVNKFPFESKLSSTELVYVQFELVYEHLFTCKENRAQFEGQKFALGRGIKLFEEIVNSWKTMASIEFEIEKKKQEYIPLFI